MFRIRNLDKSMIITGAVIISASVSAQSQSVDKGGGGAISEIIVTAQKRSQNVQDVPISITALTGESLENRGVGELVDLGQVAPGLNVTRQGGASVFFIRGVGNVNATPGNESAVATYVDGIYMPSSQANTFSFNNVERVEVLKGPQGTLFGRNATGGVIHIVTKDPDFEPNFKTQLGYGRYDTSEANFYGSTGLNDIIAADMAVYYKDQKTSPIKNQYPGVKHVPDSVLSIRSKWLFDVNDSVTARLSMFYDDYESGIGMSRQPLPGALAVGGIGYSGDFHTIINEYENYMEVSSKGISGQIDYSFGKVGLTSITGYVENDAFYKFDHDGTIGFIQASDQPVLVETLSQEVRLHAEESEKISWMLGLYYFNNSTAFDPGQVVFTPNFTLVSASKVKTESLAIFGDTTWKFSDKTSLTLGLRWTEDDLEHSGVTTFNSSVFPACKQNDQFEKLTYRVGLDHGLTDNILIYATHSRGYKAGVYNLTVTGMVPPPAIAPEVIDATELGVKSDGWFQSRLRLNGAVFLYDYKDLQVLTIGVASQVAANAAKARIAGAEIEGFAQITDRLAINFGVSYLDSEYKEFFGLTNRPNVDVNGNPTGGNQANIPQDFSGNDLVRAPGATYSIAATYTVPTTIGTFSVEANLYYDDGFYWDTANRLKEPSYEVVNLQLAWTDLTERYRVGLWGKNITDTEYSIYTNDSPSSGDAYTPGLPLMYGGFIEYMFR